MVRTGPLAPALLCAVLLSWAGSLALPVTTESPTTEQKSCHLPGTWVNELGSRIIFGAVDAAGQFSGGYRTAVTSSNQRVGGAIMRGTTNAGPQPTVGFIVKWPDAGSVAVFAGQCFVDGDGRETLQTTWLLRREAAAHAEDWKATMVGRNVFVRLQ